MVTHTNRKGDTYYLHRHETKAGGTRYTFSKTKNPERLVDEIPDGYEIFEKITTAQVFLRKIRPSKFSELETARLRRALEEHTDGARFETDDDAFVVFERTTPQLQDLHVWFSLLDDDGFARYTAVLRFELEDAETRTFAARRMHFSLDDWWYLSSGPLTDLLDEYLPHVGRESFYELM